MAENFYRIGGASIELLTPKSGEFALVPPGISLIKAASPQAAAALMRFAFGPRSPLGKLAGVVGEITSERVRAAGFDLFANPTNKFGDAHYRLVHPVGVSGFNRENLLALSKTFIVVSNL